MHTINTSNYQRIMQFYWQLPVSKRELAYHLIQDMLKDVTAHWLVHVHHQ